MGRSKLTTKEAIRRAQLVHGLTYDYSEVDYQHSQSLLRIICKTHGAFYKTLGNHVNHGQGCPLCKADEGLREYKYATRTLYAILLPTGRVKIGTTVRLIDRVAEQKGTLLAAHIGSSRLVGAMEMLVKAKFQPVLDGTSKQEEFERESGIEQFIQELISLVR